MPSAQQAGNFQEVSTSQANRALEWAASFGFVPSSIQVEQILEQVMGSRGQLTYAVTSVFGAVTSLFLIIVIGLFVAVEPGLYERGAGWMLAMRSRDGFYRTIDRMAYTQTGRAHV